MFIIKCKWGGYFGRDKVTGHLTLDGTLSEAREYAVEQNAKYVANTLPDSVVIDKDKLLAEMQLGEYVE